MLSPLRRVLTPSFARFLSLPTGISETQYNELKRRIASRTNEGSVDLSYDGKIAILTLNNVPKKNAMTEKMMVDLANHVDTLEKWRDGCGLILCGANHTFCSGFDLLASKRYVDKTPEKLELNLLMQTSLTRLRRLGLVSVALIEGYAIGGGAEVSTFADFRVMKSDAHSYIRFIHNRLSLCPGWGGASRLTQIIGRKAALRVLLQAEKLSAAQAHEFGIVDDIVTGDAMEAAKQFLFDYTQFNPVSSQAIKRIVASRCSE